MKTTKFITENTTCETKIKSDDVKNRCIEHLTREINYKLDRLKNHEVATAIISYILLPQCDFITVNLYLNVVLISHTPLQADFLSSRNRELKQTTTTTATRTRTSLNKRSNEENNSCARAL